MRLYSIIIALLLTGIAMAPADARVRVAVLDFASENADGGVAVAARDLFEVSLHKSCSAELIERTRIDLIMKERTLAGRNCSDASCTAAIGRLLRADAVVTGSVTRLKSTIVIAARVVRVGTGEISVAESVTAADDEAIPAATASLATAVSDRMNWKPAGDTGNEKVNAVYYIAGLLMPGAGQIYAGKTLKGTLILAPFLGCLGYTAYAIGDYYTRSRMYYRTKPGFLPMLTGQNMTEKLACYFFEKDYIWGRTYRKYGIAARNLNIAITLDAAVYLINLVDLIFFSRPGIRPRSLAGYTYGTVDVECVHYRVESDNATISIALSYDF